MSIGTLLEEVVENRHDRALLLSCFSKAYYFHAGGTVNDFLATFISELRKAGGDFVMKCQRPPAGWHRQWPCWAMRCCSEPRSRITILLSCSERCSEWPFLPQSCCSHHAWTIIIFQMKLARFLQSLRSNKWLFQTT